MIMRDEMGSMSERELRNALRSLNDRYERVCKMLNDRDEQIFELRRLGSDQHLHAEVECSILDIRLWGYAAGYRAAIADLVSGRIEPPEDLIARIHVHHPRDYGKPPTIEKRTDE